MKVEDAGVREEVLAAIAELKVRRGAAILAHNYQPPAVQDLADFVGDSLDLSRRAQALAVRVIVFCGVRFMAETAAILSPEKIVLLPEPRALCPMARMIDAQALRRLKRKHPEAIVVGYVNTTAEVKAECDLCCTSANAAEIVTQIPKDREIIFVPDQYLGAHVMGRAGRRLILWPGYCPTHARIQAAHIRARRRICPGAVVIAHPECRPDVTAEADAVLSTGGMLRFARETDAQTIIVATETGLLHRLQKENPTKAFLAATAAAICPNMKLTSPESILAVLERMEHRILIDESLRQRAYRPVAMMLATTGAGVRDAALERR